MSVKHLSKGSKMPTPIKDKLRLYSNRLCPYAQRIHLVLDAKKLQYETIFINIKYQPDWYTLKHPHGKIPLLELENGETLSDDLVIVNYLDEKYPQNTLYPKDPLQKAKDCLLINAFNKIINSVHAILLCYTLDNGDDVDIIRNGLDDFQSELDKRGPFFGGSKPGMVDYLIWPWVERADVLKLFVKRLSLKQDKYAKLLEWKERMCEDKAVKKSFLDTETHIKFIQSLRAGIPDYDLVLSSE